MAERVTRFRSAMSLIRPMSSAGRDRLRRVAHGSVLRARCRHFGPSRPVGATFAPICFAQGPAAAVRHPPVHHRASSRILAPVFCCSFSGGRGRHVRAKSGSRRRLCVRFICVGRRRRRARRCIGFDGRGRDEHGSSCIIGVPCSRFWRRNHADPQTACPRNTAPCSPGSAGEPATMTISSSGGSCMNLARRQQLARGPSERETMR